jgi:hypothetical protein
MPTPTYVPLANITLGSSASTVTFSSIPATYRDLVLAVNGETTGGNPSILARFNTDSGTNYPQVFMWATTVAQSGTNAASGFQIASSTVLAGNRFIGNVSVMDYSATDKHKTVLARSGYRNGSSIDIVEASASRWTNTAAITTLAVLTSANNFASGTTFALYGIAS